MKENSYIIKKETIGNVFIYLFIFLCLLDLIYPAKGEHVSRVVPVVGRSIFMLLTIIYVIIVRVINPIKTTKSYTANSLVAFFLLFLVISVFHPSTLIQHFNYLIKIIYWFFCYWFFYNSLVRESIEEKKINLFVKFAVVIYFLVVIRDFINVDLWSGSKEFFVSNNSYILLKLLPLVLYFNNKYKNILLFIILIGIIFSFKRGAILAYLISIVFYFTYNLFKTKRKSNIFSLIMILSVGIIAINSNAAVLLTRLEDFQDTDSMGSGRGKMFRLLFSDIFQDNFDLLNLFFGNGFLSTINFFDHKIGHPILAHSDFMEFFYDFGILGLVMYCYFILRIYKLYKFFKNTEHGVIPLLVVLILFTTSIYSMNFFTPEMIYLMIPIALLESKRVKILNSL